MWIKIMDSERNIRRVINSDHVISVLPVHDGEMSRIVLIDKGSEITCIPYLDLITELEKERRKK